jgi:hypothetical protein
LFIKPHSSWIVCKNPCTSNYHCSHSCAHIT